MSIINGRQVGGGAPLKTMTLVDENGLELLGIVVDKEVIFDADPVTDIREGKTVANDMGVVVGEKQIPSYNTREGVRVVSAGSQFVLPNDYYDYTKLQAIFCPFNTTITDSVAAEKVAIENNVYNVQSIEPYATIIKDEENTRIDFGFVNTSDNSYVIRFFMYKEIY